MKTTRITAAGVFVSNILTLQIDGWDVANLQLVDNEYTPEDGEPPVLSDEEYQAVIDAICRGLGIDEEVVP